MQHFAFRNFVADAEPVALHDAEFAAAKPFGYGGNGFVFAGFVAHVPKLRIVGPQHVAGAALQNGVAHEPERAAKGVVLPQAGGPQQIGDSAKASLQSRVVLAAAHKLAFGVEAERDVRKTGRIHPRIAAVLAGYPKDLNPFLVFDVDA